ncbi:hypothetical protein PIB30_065091 [Stylosanthes scabra]|uniref:Uncharacterized protein n=1 Tax=Stylosanthes scabra TaxID=79078 RepID=A0ABU6UKR1_9FABA|nr:hypothetical protein [Stylosanthes scabra]
MCGRCTQRHGHPQGRWDWHHHRSRRIQQVSRWCEASRYWHSYLRSPPEEEGAKPSLLLGPPASPAESDDLEGEVEKEAERSKVKNDRKKRRKEEEGDNAYGARSHHHCCGIRNRVSCRENRERHRERRVDGGHWQNVRRRGEEPALPPHHRLAILSLLCLIATVSPSSWEVEKDKSCQLRMGFLLRAVVSPLTCCHSQALFRRHYCQKLPSWLLSRSSLRSPELIELGYCRYSRKLLKLTELLFFLISTAALPFSKLGGSNAKENGVGVVATAFAGPSFLCF